MSQTRTYAWPRNKTGRLEKTTLLAQFDHCKARCADLEVENANLRAFLEAERRLNNALESRLLLYGETA